MWNILISGEGIAGAALALGMSARAIQPTIIERAPSFEARGHVLSLKGNGVTVLRRMGLEPACRARACEVARMQLLTPKGRLLRQAPSEAAMAAVGEYMMINRGQLHEALHEALADRVEVRWGTSLTALEQDRDGVLARFSDGREQRFDLVIGADGVHSRTRTLAFGSGLETPFGAEYLAITQPGAHGLALDEVFAYMGSGRSVALVPAGSELLHATIYHPADDPIPRGDIAMLRAWLLDRFADFDARVLELFARMDTSTWTFRDSIAMVTLPSPVRGRVVLTGDDGFCPTFMSGMGASLALQSAYLLCNMLSEADDLDAALRSYADKIAPIAARYQASARAIRKSLIDRNRARGWLRNLAIGAVPLAVWQRRAAEFYDAERSLSDVGACR